MRHISIAAVLFALTVAGPGLPPFGRAAAASAVTAGKVDAAAAVKMLTDYRASHGLSPVKLDPQLQKVATAHAERMAAADMLEHVLSGEGSFPQRFTAVGYAPAIAAEDIGAGYMTLADAMTGWEHSPPHNANLLLPNVTGIGIALYSTSVGQYHTYWSLVLAAPAPPPPKEGGPEGITVGPFGFFGG